MNLDCYFHESLIYIDVSYKLIKHTIDDIFEESFMRDT